MNKMDEFIKKQLEEFSEDGSDVWNVPNDSHWEAARKFLPKKKKKKNPIFFFLITLGLLSVICISLFLINPKQNPVEFSEHKIAPVLQASEDVKNKSTKQQEIETMHAIEDKEQILLENLETAQIENSVQETVLNKTDENLAQTNTSSQNFLEQNSNSAPVKEKEIANTAISNVIENSILKEDLEFVETAVDNQLDQLGKDQIEELAYLERRRTELSIHPVQHRDTPILNIHPNVLTGVRKNEIGIAHKQFLITLLPADQLLEEEEGVEPGSTVLLDRSYLNLNLNYNRYLNRRWSLSTGINLSRLDLCFDLSINSFYKDTDLEMFLISDITNVTESRAGINESELQIQLKEGVELLQDDLLNFSSKVNLNLRAIELPFHINYHFYKSNFEFAIGAGINIEYLMADQDEIEIFISKNNEIINLEAVQAAASERIWDDSVYFKLGSKYYLNEQLNFGWNNTVNLSDLAFSYTEAGIYYRFF